MNVVFLLSSNVVHVNDVGGVTVTVTVAVDPRYDLGVDPSAFAIDTTDSLFIAVSIKFSLASMCANMPL